MGTEIFLSSLGLPANCSVGSTVFKKFFYNMGLSAADRKLITNQVEKIIIQYNLTPKNLNIQPYKDDEREYLEVQVIETRLNDVSRHKRIAEIIMRAIPYPMILQLTHGKKIMIVAGMSRINLADREKQTIDEFVFSPWLGDDYETLAERKFLKDIHFSKLSNLNFYSFYKDFVDQLYILNAASLIKTKLSDLSPDEAKAIYNELGKIERELLALRAQLKKEDMFNRKVELNLQIKHIEKKQKGLLRKLHEQKAGT